MRLGIVSLLVFCVQASAVCQSDYAVTVKGDTLKNEIRIFTFDRMDRVQVGTGKTKESFLAVQIRMLSLDGKTYQPVKIDDQIRMMELISQGFLSLYGFRVGDQSSYDGRFLVKLGGQSIELPNLTFKKTMASFLKECHEVAQKIEKGDWGKKQLDSILFNYNKCAGEKSAPPPVNQNVVKLEELKTKVAGSNIAKRKDAIDLLNDIIGKVGRKEAVPNYLLEGLKSFLDGSPEFSADLAAVVEALKN